MSPGLALIIGSVDYISNNSALSADCRYLWAATPLDLAYIVIRTRKIRLIAPVMKG